MSPETTCSIKGYAVDRKDVHSQTIAHGGVLLAVHHSLPVRPLLLSSPLQAVAARVHLSHREVTICSLYLPPGVALPVVELRRLLLQLPAPVLVVGGFNAHGTAWGYDLDHRCLHPAWADVRQFSHADRILCEVAIYFL